MFYRRERVMLPKTKKTVKPTKMVQKLRKMQEEIND